VADQSAIYPSLPFSFGEQADSVLSQDFEVCGQTRILQYEVVCISAVIEFLAVWRHNKPKTKNRKPRTKSLWRVTGSGVQHIRSMKTRFRNANLLITYVLDSCVKLLAVLHTSSAQGQSVDLSVDIATGRRGMIDIISTLGPPAVALYSA